MDKSEIENVIRHYPKLGYCISRQAIAGVLEFAACFETDKNGITLNIDKDSELTSHPNFIKDSFNIAIAQIKNRQPSDNFYSLFIDQKHIKQIAQIQNIENLLDLHIYKEPSSNGFMQCCVSLGHITLQNAKLLDFIDRGAISFLYRLSYVKKHGITSARQNLWGEYSHGKEGLQQWQKDNHASMLLISKRNDICVCGSGKKFKYCCLEKVPIARHIKEQINRMD